jgi:hypothetical protein
MLRLSALAVIAFAGLSLAASGTVVAQQAAVQTDATAEATAQLAALQQQMVAAQEEIVRLRAELLEKREQAARLATCASKNERLAAIGEELIAAYAKRYRRGAFLPFDTGRRKLEAELQEIGSRLYDNRLDAGARPNASGQAPAADSASPTPNAPGNAAQ